MPKPENALRVPKEMQARYDEITAITDRVCREHLNDEYAFLCRKTAAALSRKRPSPLLGGRANTWAAGIAQAMGRINFLSDKSTKPYMKAADLAKAFDVSAATASSKAAEVWRALDLIQLHPDYCLPALLDNNPLVWMLKVNGIIVDIRSMPISAQLQAFDQGFIPYVPALKDVPEEQWAATIETLLMEEGVILVDDAPASQIYQIKITLDRLNPAIWRRVEVPDNYTLGDLHMVIQIAMGWGDAHLHEFVVNKQRYSMVYDEMAQGAFAEAEAEDEDEVYLSDVILKKGQKFRYTYDFGDDWQHTLSVEKMLPVDPARVYPVCTGGEHACPPNDVGGAPGYVNFVQAMLNVEHPDHADMVEWYGPTFDPYAFNLDAVNDALRATFGETPA